MADFSDELLTYWKTVSAITALVGTTTNARIWPDEFKQGGALPAIVYDEAGGEDITQLGSKTGAGLCRSVVHIYAYGATRAAANELAEIVRIGTQNGARGNFGSTYVNEVVFSSHRDWGTDSPQDSSSTPRYWTRRICDIWHAQATS